MEPWEFKPAGDLGLKGMSRFRSYRRETGLTTGILRGLWWGLSRAYFRLWHRLEIEGMDHLPLAPPFVLAANHTSHLDALILMAALPFSWRDVVFPIAAKDVFFENHGVAAFGAVFANALPIWRRSARSHEMQELRNRLSDPPSVFIVFPEGTRSRDGNLLPFKSGLGRLVAGSDSPVVPCWIAGAFGAAPPGAHLPRPKKIRIRIGCPVCFREVPDDRIGWDEVAAGVREAVLALESLDQPS
jgi:1-acyl-sn-glycerol-3-phosphate acyltransferase